MKLLLLTLVLCLAEGHVINKAFVDLDLNNLKEDAKTSVEELGTKIAEHLNLQKADTEPEIKFLSFESLSGKTQTQLLYRLKAKFLINNQEKDCALLLIVHGESGADAPQYGLIPDSNDDPCAPYTISLNAEAAGPLLVDKKIAHHSM